MSWAACRSMAGRPLLASLRQVRVDRASLPDVKKTRLNTHTFYCGNNNLQSFFYVCASKKRPMEFEKLAAQIKLEIAKLDTTPEVDKINKVFDEKIRKVEEARREKLATVPDNSVEKKKLIAALEALGEKWVEPAKKKAKE